MKFLGNKKKLVLFAVLAAILIASGAPKETHAELIGEITSVAVYQATLALSYLFGKIASALFTFSASLIDLALRLNSLLLISPIVKNGWKFILNFTNLGFVLGIIVIAFATILRLENYAMKQTLRNLIIAALLVNFSLVIAGAFISVSDLVTNNFNNYLNNVPMSDKLTNLLKVQTLNDPFTDLGKVATTTGAEAYSRVVLKGVDIVNAPINLLFGTNLSAERSAWGNNKSILEMITGKATTSEGLLLLVSSFIFVVIFTFLAALTYLAIAIMLLVRYVFLGILLILSPIVWLLWIFPSTSSYWKKWWDNFLRWTFFAPVMMFFIILAIISLGNPIIGDSVPISPDGHQIFIDNMAKKQKGLEFDFMKMGNLVVVIGILWGGLMAANSMGIAGANVAMNLAKGAGKGASAWAGRKTWGGLRGGYSRLAGAAKWGDKSIEASKMAGESKTRLGKMWYGAKARTFANLSAPAEREPERYKNEVSKLTMAQATAQLSSDSMLMPGGRKAALAEHIANNLHKLKIPGGKQSREIMEDMTEDIYEEKTVKDSDGNLLMQKTKVGKKKIGEKGTGKYEDVSMDDEAKQKWAEKNLIPNSMKNIFARSKMDFSAIEKKVGVSNEMVNAHQDHGAGSEEFVKAAAKFYGGLKKSDAADIGKALKRIYNTPISFKDADERSLANNISKALGGNFAIISSMLPHMGGYKVVNNFKTDFENANPHLADEFNTIFKNFRTFVEGGSPSITSAAPTASASSKP